MDRGIFDSKEKTLKSGIKLISIKKETSLFSAHAAVEIGSLYENKNEKGIAHFVEHMLFKGTKERNNEILNEQLENIGGEYNAYTDHNCTVIGVTGLKEELEKSILLIADMLMNSIFSEDEIEKEREVILAEIRTSKDDVEDYSFRKAHEAAYRNSPLKYDTIGEEKTVKKFKREDLLNFYKRYYLPNNCCISVVSPYDHEEIEACIEGYFKQWECNEIIKNEVVVEDNIHVKKISYKKNIEQSSVIYIFTFHNLDKKQELALKILNHKFGESTNSILFREVRENRGLAYDVYSNIDTTNFVKTLYIYTAVSSSKVERTIKCIDDCIERIKNKTIIFDNETINLMKKILKTAVVSTIEDTTDLGNYVLHQSIDGEDIYDFINDMENLKNIKSQDLYEVAREVFKNPTMHILLPKESDSFAK